MGAVHRSGFSVHSHGPDLAFGAEQADLVNPLAAAVDCLGAHCLGAEAALRHLHSLVQRHTGRLDPRIVPLAAIDQLLGVAGQRSSRRKQRDEGHTDAGQCA